MREPSALDSPAAADDAAPAATSDATATATARRALLLLMFMTVLPRGVCGGAGPRRLMRPAFRPPLPLPTRYLKQRAKGAIGAENHGYSLRSRKLWSLKSGR